MILQIVSITLWLLAIPFACGLGIIKFMKIKEGKRTMAFITGQLFLIALFQVVYIPFIIWHNNFTHLVYTFMAFAGISTIGFLFYGSSHLKQLLGDWGKSLRMAHYSKVFWVVVFLLVGFQLYMSVAYQFIDGDDANYIANSLIVEASHSGTMYTTIPETGIGTALNTRRALSSFTIYIGFLGRVSNIHTTIIAHVILPFMLIPLMYCIYLQIGRIVLKENRNYIPLFMILINLFYIYGNNSIYTNATFALTRTWQGKSVLANIMIPATFLGLLFIYTKRPKKGILFFLSLVICGALSASSMGLLLIPVLLNIGLIAYAIGNQFWRKEVS